MNFVASLTIVNDNPSLSIVNDDHSLAIVNIIVNNFFFQKRSFKKKQSYNKRSQTVFKKRSFSNTIVIRFLKVQNEFKTLFQIEIVDIVIVMLGPLKLRLECL